MKLLPQLVLTLSAGLLCATGAVAAEDVRQLLSEAQQAYLRGDLTTAKAGFEMVYRIDPRNQVAIGYLRRIKVDEAGRGKGKGDQEKALAAVILPKVEFREATLVSALDFFKQMVSKVTEGKQAVSFVTQVPEEQLKQPVTLSLTNVPVTEALRYLGGLAGVTFEYDKYAIVVKPKGGAVSAQAAPVAR